MTRAVLLCAFVVAACATPDYPDCNVRCSDVHGCPRGLTCGGDGFCHDDPADDCSSNGGPDNPVDERDAGGTDAAPDADPGARLTVDWFGPGAGAIASTPEGLSCAGSCDHHFAPGTAVTLTATASSPGSTFMGWSGACSGTAECALELTEDAQVRASFVTGAGECSQPFELDAKGGTYISTMTGTGTSSVSCTTSTGVDRSFRILPARSGSMRIEVITDFWPVAVYVTTGCGSSPVSCTSATGPWPTVDFTVPVTAGTVYSIVVGHATYTGTATLTHTLRVTVP